MLKKTIVCRKKILKILNFWSKILMFKKSYLSSYTLATNFILSIIKNSGHHLFGLILYRLVLCKIIRKLNLQCYH